MNVQIPTKKEKRKHPISVDHCSVRGISVCFLIMAMAGSLQCGAQDIKKGLVGHWPLNSLVENSVLDLGPNKFHAIPESITLADGRGGKVSSFDGVKSLITLPSKEAFSMQGDYSVSFWVKLAEGHTKTGTIFSQTDLRIYPFNGILRVTIRNPEYPKTGQADLMGPSINNGQWYHVVFSRSGTSGESVLYIDGVEGARNLFPHKPAEWAPITLGDPGRLKFQGELSDLRIYSRVLTPQDVSALHGLSKAP